jgi:hypothetical protein
MMKLQRFLAALEITVQANSSPTITAYFLINADCCIKRLIVIPSNARNLAAWDYEERTKISRCARNDKNDSSGYSSPKISQVFQNQ